MYSNSHYLHRHFVPNITFGATMVKWLRKKLPDVFFGKHLSLIMCTLCQ